MFKRPSVCQFVSTTTCPVTVKHWKELGSVFAQFLKVFIYFDEFPPWAFSSLAQIVPALSAFPQVRENCKK